MDNVSREEQIRVCAYEFWEKTVAPRDAPTNIGNRARPRYTKKKIRAETELSHRVGCPGDGKRTLKRSPAVDRPAEP